MLGFNAFAVQPFSAVGSQFFGSSTQSFNFTETSAAIKLASGVVEMSAIGSKASVGVGILGGVSSISSNFNESANGIRIAAGTDALLILSNGTLTTSPTRIRPAVSEQSFNFNKESDAIKIASGVFEISSIYNKTSAGNLTLSGSSDLSFSNT